MNGNTDPATFVSIAQDPAKPEGWNVVVLSDGSVWKFGGVVERDEGGIVVQRIALTDNETGEIGPDGPVITPEIALAIEAVGGVVPPIHATKVIPPDDASPTSNVSRETSAPASIPQQVADTLSTLTDTAKAQGQVPGHARSHQLIADIGNLFQELFKHLGL